MLRLAVLGGLFAAASATASSPLEYYFTADTVNNVTTEHGCTVSRWNGIDPQGVVAQAWFASVVCPDGAQWTETGFPRAPISIYVWDGAVTVAEETLNLTSSFIWVGAGFATTVTIKGKAVVHGGPFHLHPGKGAQFTSSYSAPKYRLYDAADAIANRLNASFVHDPHQRDGDEDSNCLDFVYASRTRVDPPAVTVLACNTSGSWVSNHFHPWGATYIPLSGDACFNTDKQHCIGPGAARWTSPLLRYSESFTPPKDEPSVEAKRVIAAAGFGSTLPACDKPIIMGVTNFDPAHEPEGTPNFDDIPTEGMMMAVRPPTIASSLLQWPSTAH